LRASGEERHPLEQIDLPLGDPVLSDVITSARFELLENTRGSVPPTDPWSTVGALDTYRIYDGTDENGIVGTVAPGLFAQEGRPRLSRLPPRVEELLQ
jgi:hypothetical protein